MGKASFGTLQDASGRIQLFVTKDALGDAGYDAFKRWDLGDILGAEGTLFKTKTGELSVRVTTLRLLTKSLRPLPDKFHGMSDQEQKYRQRYVDLITDEAGNATASRPQQGDQLGPMRRNICWSSALWWVERLRVRAPDGCSIAFSTSRKPCSTMYWRIELIALLAGREAVACRFVGDQVDVALAVLLLLVAHAVELVGQRAQALGQEAQGRDANRQLAGLGLEERALGTEDVAEGPALERVVAGIAERVFRDEQLDAAGRILQGAEARLCP